MKIRATAAVALAALAAVSLTACRDSRGSATPDNGEVSIMVGGIDKVIYLPAMLAQQLGYFKDEGLKVSMKTEPAGATAENSLISGDVQGVVGFYDHTIDLQTQDKCIQSVVQMADVPGEVELVGSRQADAIKSPADFKGKKLGFTSPGSSTDFLTQYLATKNGVATADYTGVKAGAGTTFISAMDNGQIDAGMTTDPTVAQLTNTGKAKVMLDMRTVDGTRAALGGLYPSSSLYMNCDYVAQHKQTVQKLANAFVKTLRFINSHPAEEIADKMPADYAGGDKALYVKAINDTKAMFNSDGKMKADGAKNVLDVLAQFSPKVKPKKDKIDLSRTYTTEFVDKVAG
jgi:NitT/TauT family transport system substrate-binding protein